jgi:hypothetical protein
MHDVICLMSGPDYELIPDMIGDVRRATLMLRKELRGTGTVAGRFDGVCAVEALS